MVPAFRQIPGRKRDRSSGGVEAIAQWLFEEAKAGGGGRSNYLRFRLSPDFLPLASRSREKTSSGTKRNPIYPKSGRDRKLPTRGCWAMPCTAREPSSP